MSYIDFVNKIKDLKWKSLTQTDLESLMFLSLETAKEFAESLQIALSVFPDDALLKSMAEGELKTNNLKFGGWNQKGDHWEFLQYFLSGKTQPPKVATACAAYRKAVALLPNHVRAMSIFSREKELPEIFSQILKSPAWKNALPSHLQAFRFYLLKHIALDSEEGGHGNLVEHHTVTNDVDIFYKARLKLYINSIPRLTEQ